MTTPSPLLARAVDSAFERLAERGFDALNDVQKTVVCVWSACGEVDNGGFEQFFFNDSGDWSLHAPRAFREIGCPQIAELFQDALDLFPDRRPSPDLAIRRRQLDDLPDAAIRRLVHLGSAFDSRRADEPLERFVRRNRSCILTTQVQ